MTDRQRVGRLGALRVGDLNAEQAALWDSVMDGPRGTASWMVDDGVLAGPFNAWLNIPEVGRALAAAGEVLRFSSGLPPVVRELVILTVGAHWRSEFEFWAHSGIGRREGMADDLIEAIAVGDRDAVAAHSDAFGAAAYDVVHGLVTTGHVEETLMAALQAVAGDARAVEVVTLAGYYSCVSFTLNAFAVPLPDGVTPRFGDIS
ncbi:MAG: carboxymuconolactone decarboxylase family protein [Ilumatobacteraceae bacterium]